MSRTPYWPYWLTGLCLIFSGWVIGWAYQLQQKLPEVAELSKFVPLVETIEPSPTPRIICDLVLAADLEAIVGESLLGPEINIDHEQGVIEAQNCMWSAASGQYTPTISLSMRKADELVAVLTQAEASTSAEATAAASVAPLQTQWQTEQSRNATRPGYRELLNVAEAAYVSPTGLYLLTKNRMIRIFVALDDPSQVGPIMEQIATLVLRAVGE